MKAGRERLNIYLHLFIHNSYFPFLMSILPNFHEISMPTAEEENELTKHKTDDTPCKEIALKALLWILGHTDGE